MNSPADIQRYQDEQREYWAKFWIETARWIAQVIVTPALLALLLWRVW